jgi:hypothetical protein
MGLHLKHTSSFLPALFHQNSREIGYNNYYYCNWPCFDEGNAKHTGQSFDTPGRCGRPRLISDGKAFTALILGKHSLLRCKDATECALAKGRCIHGRLMCHKPAFNALQHSMEGDINGGREGEMYPKLVYIQTVVYGMETHGSIRVAAICNSFKLGWRQNHHLKKSTV